MALWIRYGLVRLRPEIAYLGRQGLADMRDLPRIDEVIEHLKNRASGVLGFDRRCVAEAFGDSGEKFPGSPPFLGLFGGLPLLVIDTPDNDRELSAEMRCEPQWQSVPERAKDNA